MVVVLAEVVIARRNFLQSRYQGCTCVSSVLSIIQTKQMNKIQIDRVNFKNYGKRCLKMWCDINAGQRKLFKGNLKLFVNISKFKTIISVENVEIQTKLCPFCGNDNAKNDLDGMHRRSAQKMQRPVLSWWVSSLLEKHILCVIPKTAAWKRKNYIAWCGISDVKQKPMRKI